MQAAREKYGQEVYLKRYQELQDEFGAEAFPDWLTRFRGHENPHKMGVNTNVQLADITECFCYRDYTLDQFDRSKIYLTGVTPEQLDHIVKFAIVFMYDE